MRITLLMFVLFGLAMFSLQAKSNQLSFGQTDCMNSNPQVALECLNQSEWKKVTDSNARMEFMYPPDSKITQTQNPLGYSIELSNGLVIQVAVYQDPPLSNLGETVNNFAAQLKGVTDVGPTDYNNVYHINTFTPDEGPIYKDFVLTTYGGLMYVVGFGYSGETPLSLIGNFWKSFQMHGLTPDEQLKIARETRDKMAEELQIIQGIKDTMAQMGETYVSGAKTQHMADCTMKSMMGDYVDLNGRKVPPPGC